jgi:hypothetical protein
MQRSTRHPYVLASAAAVCAGLIAGAPLASGDADIYSPLTSTFSPTVAEGYPPLVQILQGTETWGLDNQPTGIAVLALYGTDTQTTVGSFTNDDFLETDSQLTLNPGGAGIPLPDEGSQIDLANFGGGYENEWINSVDSFGHSSVSDTFVTPFGDVNIPVAQTSPEIAQAADSATLNGVLIAVQETISEGNDYFSNGAAALAAGDLPHGLTEILTGVNNWTVGVGDDLLVDSYEALNGAGAFGVYDVAGIVAPTGVDDAISEVQDYTAEAQHYFSEAVTALGSGDVLTGLSDIAQGNIDGLAYAPDALIVGLAESLFDVAQ